MSGMREYLTGRSDGMKCAHPRETERREPHATREDATATKHTNHKPKGTKRASGDQTRRKHNTTSTSHTTATATNKHHGINTNANTGMLCATRRRTQQ